MALTDKDFLYQYFKEIIAKKEVNKIKCKDSKENMRTMSHQIKNTNQEIGIIKKRTK